LSELLDDEILVAKLMFVVVDYLVFFGFDWSSWSYVLFLDERERVRLMKLEFRRRLGLSMIYLESYSRWVIVRFFI
jgi:hypothetical protein